MQCIYCFRCILLIEKNLHESDVPPKLPSHQPLRFPLTNCFVFLSGFLRKNKRRRRSAEGGRTSRKRTVQFDYCQKEHSQATQRLLFSILFIRNCFWEKINKSPYPSFSLPFGSSNDHQGFLFQINIFFALKMYFCHLFGIIYLYIY